MSEIKEENNSPSDVKEEEKSPNIEDNKALEESSKDSDKDSAKDDNMKKESGKGGAKEASDEEDDEDDDDEDDESEEGMGLLDRPVEVTGCRARKKVERLEVSFAQPKGKQQDIPVGRGDKLRDCARIEYQISKTGVSDLKPLHRVLFSRNGSVPEIKKNIRKFSGFSFVKGSPEYDKKKAQMEKFTISILKRMCEVVDIEHGGTKEALVNRLLEFLLEPKDSGRALPKKKSSKDKRKSSKTVTNSKKPKVKKNVSSEELDSANESASEEVSENEDGTNESDNESKKKSKNASKIKKTPAKTKKTEKKEKNKKGEKKSSAKRKRDDTSSDSSEEPSSKKTKMPSDDDIKKLVKRILDTADLQEITMKKVIKQVADAYPDCDLSHKKGFIKTTIKSVIS